MKMLGRLVSAGVGALALMLVLGGAGGTAYAAGGTVYVGIPGLGCPTNGVFAPDLQLAIDMVPQPKQIIVCTTNDFPLGFEPIVIDSKSNLKLIAKGLVGIAPPDDDDPTPEPEPVFGGPLVHVIGSTNITIQGFYIDGDDFLASGPNAGIVFENSSGTITKNHILRIMPSSFLDTPDTSLYTSIQVTGNSGQKVTISSNTIDEYQGLGIHATGNIKLTISKNLFLGTAFTTPPEIPQAILLEGMTGGTISGNKIQGNFSMVVPIFSAGIQLYATSGVKVTKNTITNTAFGILIYADGDAVMPGPSNSNTISGNKLSGVPQGITVEAVDEDGVTTADPHADLNKITGNTITVHSLNGMIGIGIAEDNDGGTSFTPSAFKNTISGNKLYGFCPCFAIDPGPISTILGKNTIGLAPAGAGAAAGPSITLPELRHHYEFDGWD